MKAMRGPQKWAWFPRPRAEESLSPTMNSRPRQNSFRPISSLLLGPHPKASRSSESVAPSRSVLKCFGLNGQISQPEDERIYATRRRAAGRCGRSCLSNYELMMVFVAFVGPRSRPGADPRVKKKRERPQVSLSSFPDFLAISRHDQNDTKKAELARARY